MNTSPLPSAVFDDKYDIIDSGTPRHVALSGRYKKSFAYYTLRERLPVILTQIIDQLNREKDEIAAAYKGDETREEIKNVVGLISKLKYELQTDKKFEKFFGEESDKELWNVFIDQLTPNMNSFFQANWLHSECYMYRKVYSFFESTKTLKNYDYFGKMKEASLKVEAVLAIAKVMRKQNVKDFEKFDSLIKLDLWGNKADLSIVMPKQFKPTANVFKELDSFNNNLLINNINLIWNCLDKADHTKPVIVEFIADNACFELYTDLVLADYIISSQLASKVRFSLKAIPWYVSDGMPSDLTFILEYMSKHESPYVIDLSAKWKHYFDEGKFVVSQPHNFWVSPYEYFKMRDIAPDLYEYLSQAHLLIFKGDLNYRKLLGDLCWDPTENFITCLRGFLPTNLCSLRTLKSDLICGLPQGKAEELQRIDNNWMCTGEYGVIHFMERNVCKCKIEPEEN